MLPRARRIKKADILSGTVNPDHDVVLTSGVSLMFEKADILIGTVLGGKSLDLRGNQGAMSGGLMIVYQLISLGRWQFSVESCPKMSAKVIGARIKRSAFDFERVSIVPWHR